eukprot:UN03343
MCVFTVDVLNVSAMYKMYPNAPDYMSSVVQLISMYLSLGTFIAIDAWPKNRTMKIFVLVLCICEWGAMVIFGYTSNYEEMMMTYSIWHFEISTAAINRSCTFTFVVFMFRVYIL